MLQAIFLGTSGGTPATERGMPSIAIKYESSLMLWDCGEGTQRQLMRYRVGYGSIGSIFITHAHLDHYLGIHGLIETRRITSTCPKPLDLYLPGSLDIPADYPFLKKHKMAKGIVHRGKGFSISAFPVRHTRGSYGLVFQEEDRIKFDEGKAHSLGIRGRLFKELTLKGQVKTPQGTVMLEDVSWRRPGRKIVYSGDCLGDERMAVHAQGADLLIHEATFDETMRQDAIEKLHSTSVDAARLAKASQARRLILTHISPRYDDASLLLSQAAEIFSEVSVAEDGLAIEVR